MSISHSESAGQKQPMPSIGRIKEDEAAKKIEDALFEVLAQKKYLTKDLGGNTGCIEFSEEIIRKIKNRA